MNYVRETYAGIAELPLRKMRNLDSKGATTTVLLGAWMGVVEERDDGWLKVRSFGKEGWVREEHTRDDEALKLFFIDVGQGDACLIECPGRRFLVDGGPSINLYQYLTKWKYKWLLQGGHKVHFDAVFVSHFDADHFKGLIKVINDERFTFGAIYHNGIARFDKDRPPRPDQYDTDLGQTNRHNTNETREILKTTFSTVDQVQDLLDGGGLMATFQDFLESVIDAGDRVGKLARLTCRDGKVKGLNRAADPLFEVLGPVPITPTGAYTFKWFKDSSHTRNGHSLVLRLVYGNRSFLLGGDLNTDSEEYLLEHHPAETFRVDIAKSCHHGASEFTLDFMKDVKPYATVISSGDNENYAHPRADAVGCAGRYSRGARPLVFSTELARSTRSADGIHYGLINARTDGDLAVLAQMKEKRSGSDLWDSYQPL